MYTLGSTDLQGAAASAASFCSLAAPWGLEIRMAVERPEDCLALG